MALDTVKESKILIHVIKGYHVPIRSQALRDLNKLKAANKMQRGGAFNRSAGPYARVNMNVML